MPARPARAVSDRNLRDAIAEANRRIAARDRLRASADFLGAILDAKDALARLVAARRLGSPGELHARDTMLGVAVVGNNPRRATEWSGLQEDINALLDEALRSLPVDIDQEELARQVKTGTFVDTTSPAVSLPVAFDNEDVKDVAVRVLCEQGMPKASALRAVFGLEASEVADHAARKQLDRTTAAQERKKRERASERGAEPSDERKAEYELWYAKREQRRARKRRR